MGASTLNAYGVSFALEERIRLLGVATGGEPGPRGCTVRLAEPADLDEAWAGAAPERVRELRLADGRSVLAVDFDSQRGYRFHAPHHGHSLVSADGTQILCVPTEKDESWQHLLLSQLAPLAATLQGLEVFHAGGIAVDGGAALLCASSGTGKSTLIARLVLRGADLLADDAVATEVQGRDIVAQPGTELVHLVPEEADRVPAGGGLEPVTGYRMAKTAFTARRSDVPAPVRGVYMLERGSAPATTVERTAADVPALLAATLLPMVAERDRLRRHFELCARLAETVPLWRVKVADTGDRDEPAAAVWQALAAT